MTALGEPDAIAEALTICDAVGIRASVIFESPDLTWFERPAMSAIEAYAREAEGYVLYLHSKGVSAPQNPTKTAWRRLMMRELVVKWEERMSELPHYDAVGVNWRDMGPTSHFCGNFWYAAASYLRTLADFQPYYENPRYRVWDAINDRRLGCEFWIGSADAAPRLLSLICRNVDFCSPGFWATPH
jgi:hypothetical protein